MTWSAVGTWHGTNSAALTLSNQAAGNLLIAEVANFSNSTVWCTGLTGGGATWVQAGVKFSGTTNAFSAAVFLGTVTATGAQTATPTWSGTAPASYRTAAQEFHSTAGAWSFDKQGNLDSAGTSNWPSLAPSGGAGELYFGFAAALATPVSGGTSGYVYNLNVDTDNDAAAYNVSCPGTATFPVWSDGAQAFGIMVLVRETVPVPAAPPVPLPQLPPGWFPGCERVTSGPGAVPFTDPGTTDAAPAVIIPPLPEASPQMMPPKPPGWFPGSAAVTQDPGGIPFYAEPPALMAAPAVIFRVPEAAGIVDYLPLPPGYFPGSQAVAVDPGGIPFYAQPLPLLPPPAPPPLPFVAGLGGSGYNSWFTDQSGNPRLMVVEQAWALPFNAGRWNGGNWQADFNAYFSTRAAQGYTAWYGVAHGSTHVEPTALPGRSWDGVYALKINGTPGNIATGAETVTLNAPFWDRIDAMFATARRFGISCFLNMGLTYDFSDAGAIWVNATNTQGTAFGAALAARFPQASYPHVFWFFGDDDGGGNDSFWQAILTGMQGAGDTRALISMEQDTNTNCHVEFDTGAAYSGAFGVPNATYNWVYSYDAPYFGIERSYTEGGTYPHIPPLYGDGIYYGDSGGGPSAELAIRTFNWWALSSGSRGFTSTSGPSFADADALWMWGSAAAVARLTSDPNGSWATTTVKRIATFFSGLTDWHKLIPDTGNVFITAGRGTRGTCDIPSAGFNVRVGSTYVSGSVTPTGTLAVIYCRAAMSITIDQTKMGAGYTATWVDPANPTLTQSATPGATYASSGLGNNSAGDPDWVLVLQGPAIAGAANVTGTAAAVTVASPAGAPASAASITGIAAAVTVASPAGVPSGAAGTAGTAAHVTAASPAGVLASAANITGQAAPVTVAAPAGAAASAASITGTAALVTVASPAGVATGTGGGAANVAGVAAPVTVASPAGAAASAASITGIAAAVTVASPAGVLSGSAGITGAAALVTAASPAGVLAAAAATTGLAAHVTAAAPAGVPAGSGNITGAAALVTVASPAGVAFGGTSGAANVTGIAAHIIAAAPAGVLSAGNAITGIAAHVIAAAPAGVPASPPSIVNATSSPLVTAGRTSAPAVTGPGPAAAVTSKATSSPAVSDG